MLSISSSNNNYTKSQNSVNFKSTIVKTPALKEAIHAAKLDLSNIGAPKRGQLFFRAIEGLEKDGKKDTIALFSGRFIKEPIITVNGVPESYGKVYEKAPKNPGSQAQMALIDFAKERGINLKQPALVVEEHVDLIKKQLAATEQKMFDAIKTKLDKFLEK